MRYFKLLVTIAITSLIAGCATSNINGKFAKKHNHSPIYSGCEKYDVADYQKCFTEKINKYIASNFDTALANSLGLSDGRHKIIVQFEVDETGDINILLITAPHEDLKMEVERILKKLPKIKPAMQDGKYIKSMYNLPIYFNVE